MFICSHFGWNISDSVVLIAILSTRLGLWLIHIIKMTNAPFRWQLKTHGKSSLESDRSSISLFGDISYKSCKYTSIKTFIQLYCSGGETQKSLNIQQKENGWYTYYGLYIIRYIMLLLKRIISIIKLEGYW